VGDELTRPGAAGPAAFRTGEARTGEARTGALLSRSFFDRPALEVAPALLGCVLEHRTPDGVVCVALTEVEAYAGTVDPASHAYRGRTRRNAVMFGPPGHAYVYFTYGMHFCVNLVCLPAGTAEAVLLRAGAVIDGLPLARRRRVTSRADTNLARGPALLCQALAIDRAQDGADACDPASPLRILSARPDRLPGPRSACPGPWEARPGEARPGEAGAGEAGPGEAGPGEAGPGGVRPGGVRSGPRVGVREGADVAWRFWIDGDPTVSVYRPHAPRRRAKTETVTASPGEDGTMQP
jgi:DNA-3-methyladenine glycosylase